MLEAQNIVKSYDVNPVIKDVSISIKQGQICGLIGANGAGKTTLIKTLNGIYKPDKGSVTYKGKEVFSDSEIRQEIAFVADNIMFYKDFTIKYMKDFYKNTYNNWNEDRYQKLRSVFTFPEKKRIKHLSKGMKTQLSVLMSLSSMPSFMFMDEPTSGLDPFIKSDVLNLLVQDTAARGTAMLISSHDISQLEQICDRVFFMENGQILLDEDMDDLKQKYLKIQIAFDGDINKEFVDLIKPLTIKKTGRVYELVLDMDYDIFKANASKYNPLFMEKMHMTLEEIFIQKMGKERLGKTLPDIGGENNE